MSEVTQEAAVTTFTFEKLKAAFDLVKDIPPPPFFASSIYLPSDSFETFTVGGRQYVGGHPDLWERIPVQRGDQFGNSLGAIEIHDLATNYTAYEDYYMAKARAIAGGSEQP